MTTPAPRQDRPDAADLATVLARVRWPLRLTWAGLWAERIARRFWPLATLVMAGLTAQGFAVFDLLPIEAAWLLVLALALGLLAALVWGLRGFHRPSRAEALARLDATLPGQPLATLADHMAIGGGDPAAEAVWAAHRARMASRAAQARAVQPDLRLAARDPYGLRHMALIGLVMALIFGSVWRVADLGTPGGSAQAAGPSWEGWATPPAHTGKPTLYLADQTAERLDLPVGTRLQIRLYGEVGDLTLAETVSARTAPPPASEPVQEFAVIQSGSLEIAGAGGRRWEVTALPDTAPTVTATAPPSRDSDNRMSLPFSAKDDHGITGGTATITLDLAAIDRRYGLSTDPEPREPLVLDLPLPISGNRATFDELLVEDLSQHPFANLPVQISLSVSDAAGQTGTATPIAAILPAQRFFDPLAAALIEMRRDLLWNRTNAPRVVQVLKAVTHRPQDLIRDESAFLRLRVALRRLDEARADLPPALRDELAAELWEIATLVEEGDLASARDRLNRARDRLTEAIKNGADPAEIQRLMDELREATDDYLRMLAEEQRRNPDSQMADNAQRMEMTGDQIQQMMDEIQRLMEEGKMAEAAEAMAMLQQLLDNLQITEGPGQGPGSQSMRDLGQTLRDQQGLSDEAFRQLQEGQPGQGQGQQSQPGQPGEGAEGQPDGSLADRQRQLSDRLEGLGRQGLPGAGSDKGEAGRQALDEAQRQMDEAERALREGDLNGALDRQAEAMDRLRDGIRNLGEAQADAQRRGGQPGDPAEGGTPQPGADPLGRQPGEGRRLGSDSNLLQGQDVYRRAQDLLEELRRRSGEQARPEGERDYLKRLLELF